MLPITRTEPQAAPSPTAKPRETESSESFAQTMQKANDATVRRDKAAPRQDGDDDASAHGKDAGPDASTAAAPDDGAGEEAKTDGAKAAVDVAAGLSVHAKTSLKIDSAPGVKEVKHSKGHVGVKGGDDVSVLDGTKCPAAASHPQSATPADAVARGTVSDVQATVTTEPIGKKKSGAALRPDVIAAAARNEPTVDASKGDGPTSAVDAALEKTATAGVENSLKTLVEAVVQKPGAVEGAFVPATTHSAVELRHDSRIGVAGMSGSAAPGVRGGSTAGEMTVQSYEASTSRRLEVGVSGGTLGWLKVRAEMGQGGEVHTFLRGASAAAESELRSQTMDLQSYLGVQQVKVHTVSVEASRGQGWTATADGGGDGQRQRQEGSAANGRMAKREDVTANQAGLMGGWMPVVQSVNGAGGWLNVLA